MASKWDELERWVENQQLPKGFEVLREPDWVEQFVRKMMTKALPEAAGRIAGSRTASVSESGSYYIAKIRLPAGSDRTRLSLTVRESMIRLDGLPGGKRQIVKLPGLVKPRVCRATVKDGVLYVKLRKRPPGSREYEHAIRWN